LGHLLAEGAMSQSGHQPASRELRYRVPVGRAQAELVIKNSTFIGTVGQAPGVADR